MIRTLLKKEFTKRQKKNAAYSLRSFARDLELSASTVSRLLSGEREPSPETLAAILKKLELDPNLKKQLLDAKTGHVEFTLPKDEDYVELGAKELARLNHWMYSALLEMFRSNRKVSFSVPKFAKTLGQPKELVEQKIETLLELGMIKKMQSGYRTVHSKQTAKNNRKVLDQIHEGYLEQAVIMMKHSNEEERSISGTTVLIHPARLPEAVERIRLFRRSLAGYLEAKENETDQVYRLQIALFPLERKSD